MAMYARSHSKNRFAWRTDNVLPRERSDVCFIETKRHYPLAIMAMYARSHSKNAPKAEMEEMVLEIVTALKDEVKENEWMDAEFKKVVLQKLDKITWSLIEDDMFYNDTALDEEYAAHVALANLPFLDMIERLAYIEKMKNFKRLLVILDLRKELAKFSVMGYQINAYYIPLLNRISNNALALALAEVEANTNCHIEHWNSHRTEPRVGRNVEKAQGDHCMHPGDTMERAKIVRYWRTGTSSAYYGTSNSKGVAIAVEYRAAQSTSRKYSATQDRLISAIIDCETCRVHVFSAYAPQCGCEDEEKERFWTDLQDNDRKSQTQYVMVRKRDMPVVSNAKVVPSECVAPQHKLLVVDIR
ncbi:hypothetical protein OSTOST_02126 [Ostertagia ostertagi]